MTSVTLRRAMWALALALPTAIASIAADYRTGDLC